MEIETQELTTCEVAADGCAISLGFVDSKGAPATIRLSVNQAGALIMTLPGLISKALQARFGDQSLRYAYPLDSWAFEQSTDPKHGMMTLRTSDGFSVCFPIPRAKRTRRSADGSGTEGDDTVELAAQRPVRRAWVIVAPPIYGTRLTL
jgi:hypothetical protein